MRNLVLTAAIPSGPTRQGSSCCSYKQYFIDTWRYWCLSNDCVFHIIEHEWINPYWSVWNPDTSSLLDTWQFDQVAVVDLDLMIKWDAPNFFEIEPNKVRGVKNRNEFYGWTKASAELFQPLFSDQIRTEEYINTGFIVFPTDKFREVLKVLPGWLEAKEEEIKVVQSNPQCPDFGEQTVLNYILQSMFKIHLIDEKFNVQMPDYRIISKIWDNAYINHINYDGTKKHLIMKHIWESYRRYYGGL